MGRVFLPHMDAFFEIWVGFSCLRIGVSDLHYGGRMVGTNAAEAVGTIQAGSAGVDMGTAILTAEYCPLGEHGKALQCHRAV